MQEIIAPEGQMYVHRQRNQIGYIVQAPDDEVSDWELLPQDEALALEQEWHPISEPPIPTTNTPQIQ